MENKFLNDINIIAVEMKNHDIIQSQSILHQITKTLQHLTIIKAYWFEHENTGGFYFYKTVCNIESILFKMRGKFKNLNNDRKKIINNTLIILPNMDKTLGMLKPHETINEKEIDDVLDQTKILHDVAFTTGFLRYNSLHGKSLDKNKLDKLMLKLSS